jgi:uncharacterized protein YkwD
MACTTGAKGEKADFKQAAASLATTDITIATLTPVPAGERPAPSLVPVTPTPPPSSTPDKSSTLLLATATATPTAPNLSTPSATVTPSSTPTVTPTPTVGSPTATPTATRTPDPSLLSEVEGDLLDAHNEARQNQGLSALTPNPTLMTIARQRARYMADNSSLTHYGPNGATVFTLMNAAGYSYTDGAENIHYNFGFSTTESWQKAMTEYLASPSHRAAIMKPGFKRIGIGVATNSAGTTYYSIVFSD